MSKHKLNFILRSKSTFESPVNVGDLVQVLINFNMKREVSGQVPTQFLARAKLLVFPLFLDWTANGSKLQ